MIAFIKGILFSKTPDRITILAGHVGYDIEIPLTTYYTLPELGDEVSLYIHTLVREDAIRLFGFRDDRDKRMFDVLLGVSRIGPKLALAIQSGMEYDQLRNAVMTESIATLASIPGLGKKSAERLIFEVREKILTLKPGEAEMDLPLDTDKLRGESQEVVSLLMNLGYKQKDAEAALGNVRQNLGELELKSLIKESLKLLSGRK